MYDFKRQDIGKQYFCLYVNAFTDRELIITLVKPFYLRTTPIFGNTFFMYISCISDQSWGSQREQVMPYAIRHHQ